jgi:hypothetical protein
VERHRKTATIVASNREPIEWLGLMADALLAQSAIDRLQSSAYELVLDGRKLPATPKTDPRKSREHSTTHNPSKTKKMRKRQH